MILFKKMPHLFLSRTVKLTFISNHYQDSSCVEHHQVSYSYSVLFRLSPAQSLQCQAQEVAAVTAQEEQDQRCCRLAILTLGIRH